MIKSCTQTYTCSELGVFVSADNITAECFDDIEKYVSFCFEQKKRLHEGETKREEYSKLLNVN